MLHDENHIEVGRDRAQQPAQTRSVASKNMYLAFVSVLERKHKCDVQEEDPFAIMEALLGLERHLKLNDAVVLELSMFGYASAMQGAFSKVGGECAGTCTTVLTIVGCPHMLLFYVWQHLLSCEKQTDRQQQCLGRKGSCVVLELKRTRDLCVFLERGHGAISNIYRSKCQEISISVTTYPSNILPLY